MEKWYGFEKNKARYEARKRDHLRSKLRPGIRARSWDEAERITVEHEKKQEARDRDHERKEKSETYDGAMNTIIKGMKKTAEIKQIIL